MIDKDKLLDEVKISIETGFPTDDLTNIIYEMSGMISKLMTYTSSSIVNDCVKYSAEYALSKIDKVNNSDIPFQHFSQIIKSAMGKRRSYLIKVERRLSKIKKILNNKC